MRDNPAMKALRYHVTGAIERGETVAIEGQPVNILRDNLLACYSVIVNNVRLFFRAPNATIAHVYIGETFPQSKVEWNTFRCESARFELG